MITYCFYNFFTEQPKTTSKPISMLCTPFIPSNCAPPVTERFCAQNWLTGCARFNPRSRLLAQPFGIFDHFFRNSPKYGLRYFRKTPHGEHSIDRLRSHKRTIGLNPTIHNPWNWIPSNCIPSIFLWRNIIPVKKWSIFKKSI